MAVCLNWQPACHWIECPFPRVTGGSMEEDKGVEEWTREGRGQREDRLGGQWRRMKGRERETSHRDQRARLHEERDSQVHFCCWEFFPDLGRHAGDLEKVCVPVPNHKQSDSHVEMEDSEFSSLQKVLHSRSKQEYKIIIY